MYNRGHSMATTTFWRYSVGTAMLGGAICFFFPYYAITVRGNQFSLPDILVDSRSFRV